MQFGEHRNTGFEACDIIRLMKTFGAVAVCVLVLVAGLIPFAPDNCDRRDPATCATKGPEASHEFGDKPESQIHEPPRAGVMPAPLMPPRRMFDQQWQQPDEALRVAMDSSVNKNRRANAIVVLL